MKKAGPTLRLLTAALLFAFLLASVAGATRAAPAVDGHYSAVLTGDQEVPPVNTGASGVARFHLSGNTLSYEVAVWDIEGITAAHIHEGAPGVNGPVVFTLFSGGTFDPENPVSGDVMLTNEQIDALNAGDYYVNVHTTANPAGAIRGQIGAAQTMAFNTALAGANEVPPTQSTAAGQTLLTLSADMSELNYRLFVANIQDATAAHIHLGAPGENGPVVFNLLHHGVTPDMPAEGMLAPDLTQVAALLAGDYYVNVHTGANPGGEIRGQIGAYDPPDAFHALLTGAAENPPVATDAVGVSHLMLSEDLAKLEVHVAVRDISDITAAHLHLGWPGANGPVAHTLYSGGGSFGPGSPLMVDVDLNAQSLLDLLSGYYYVNVHTLTNPGGEIRGQVVTTSVFEANLAGANEVPPVDTAATGRAVMALDGEATTLHYRLMVRDIENVTAAHIHRGAPGENGPVLIDLNGATLTPETPVSGAPPVTEDILFDMLAGDTYVNVHTTANPGGAIRGQVAMIAPPSMWAATLNGAQEVPPVDTEATGKGSFIYDAMRGMLHYTVMVSDIENVTAAHIHRGPVGVNGPVVFTLFSGGTFDADNPVGGAAALGAGDVVDLLTYFYYVNVHTSANPGGEIRGQIMPLMGLFLPVVRG